MKTRPLPLKAYLLLGVSLAASSAFALGPVPGLPLALPGALGSLPSAAPGALFLGDPRSAAFNPAAGADLELPTFGAAATFAFPTTRDSGVGGAFSAGASLPTSWGTVNAVLDAVNADSSLRGFPVPPGASALLGLSKRGGDRLALGATLSVAAVGGDRGGFGVYGGLGAELSFPALGPHGVKTIVAMTGIGPSLRPWDAYGPLVSMTPLVAMKSTLVDSGDFTLSASALTAFPGFSDAVFSAGASFGIGRNLTVDVGWTLRARETAAYLDGGDSAYLSAPRFIPTVSILFDGSSFLRYGSYGVSPALSLRQGGGGVQVAEASALFSRGEKDRQGPVVALGPLDGPAVSGLLTTEVRVPLSVKDDSRIASWSFGVFDESGREVYTLGAGNDEARKKSTFARLLSRETGVAAPTSVVVPLSALGPDGNYTLRASARDVRGNEGRPATLQLVLDSTPPRASVSVEGKDTIFTPNGDGLKDALTIQQEGSSEAEWTGNFIDPQGKVIRAFTWTEGPPRPFVWDGTDAGGRVVPDGLYTYTLSAVDEAGNRGEVSQRGIEVSATPTPVSISLDGRALSPDGDGRFDTVTARFDIPVKKGLEVWKIDVLDQAGKVFRSWTGRTDRLALPPQALVFDGRDERGNPIPDGTWRFRIGLEYANGNRPSATGEDFLVDTVPPSGRGRSSTGSFAIDRGASVIFYHDLSENALWRGVVTDEAGKTVREFVLPGKPVAPVEWNGLDAEGSPVGDGVYKYHAEGRSATGIPGRTQEVAVRVESGGVAAALIPDRKVFSPQTGQVRLIPKIERRERPVSYSLTILQDQGGRTVFSQAGASVPPTSFVWNGRDESGSLLPDGQYSASLLVRYESGIVAQTDPIRIQLDGTPPRAQIAVLNRVFSPNGDGNLDVVRFRIASSQEKEWVGEILDPKGKVALSYRWSGTAPADLSWDGKRFDKTSAADGSYRLSLYAMDEAGTETTVDSQPFVLDARVPALTVTVDKTAFSPNGDSFADYVKLRVTPSIAEGLSSLSLAVVDAADRVVKKLPIKSFTEELRWDGTTDSGQKAADGTYTVRSEATYEKGDVVSARSEPFLLDLTPPEVKLTVGPTPFSPDGDGENDLLNIAFTAADPAGIATWTLAVDDPEGYPFTQFSGKEPPATPIAWNGTDLDGNLVEAAQDYPYTLKVRDKLGNTATVTGKIPIDVFVLRDGDKLKIRISSITFAPNTASLVTQDPGMTDKNSKILDRVATVLAKFPSYRIRVEGHAVNLSGTEREERTELLPLSLARARTVVDALVERGIDRARLDAAGLGGREPLVPHGDVQSRWRNRRVEFVLVR